MLDGKKVNIRTADDFAPVPMDKYTVLAVDVDLVMKFNGFIGKEEETLNYKFQILDDKPMPEEEGQEAKTTRGRYLWRGIRPVVNPRSWLGKLAKAVKGRDLTKEEIATFDPESIIGEQVDVMVEQALSKDGQKTFVNIISFAKTVKKLEPLAESEAPKKQQPIQKATAPATAPKVEEVVDEDDPEKLIADLDAESKTEAPDATSNADAELEAAEAEAAELEAASKAAAAKAKVAKLKAAKK